MFSCVHACAHTHTQIIIINLNNILYNCSQLQKAKKIKTKKKKPHETMISLIGNLWPSNTSVDS